jgi:hypothetical protein
MSDDNPTPDALLQLGLGFWALGHFFSSPCNSDSSPRWLTARTPSGS